MPPITLVQRNDPNQAPQVMPLVPAAGDAILTGGMGDCVCVIVIFNPNGAGAYTGMRGYHGGGGLPNVNFAALFAFVPNNLTTRIIMISGPLQGSPYAQDYNRTMVRQRAAAAGLNNVMFHFRHGVGQGQVDRLGVIT